MKTCKKEPEKGIAPYGNKPEMGIAFTSRKSGSGRLRCRTLRQLGFCLTLRFDSHFFHI